MDVAIRPLSSRINCFITGRCANAMCPGEWADNPRSNPIPVPGEPGIRTVRLPCLRGQRRGTSGFFLYVMFHYKLTDIFLSLILKTFIDSMAFDWECGRWINDTVDVAIRPLSSRINWFITER
ncbi:unnamed protein product [Anisakis simplex]|uniref:Uncharacterized protein n=1 Tax=Anisakis simplex TaxID=6269 RepID=A0A0M3KKL7_ANISI|nr:unnamed protein product [Anisakis simplex]